MSLLASTTLSDAERRVVEQFVAMLEERFGDDLYAVWLYGSRARGERPRPESDIDVLVLTTGGRRDRRRVHEALYEIAEGEGVNPFDFSILVEDPQWLNERRQIESFFIQEVDRDKMVLAGIE